ncbi:hypothetical protein [Streptomyces lavendulae]|uniref:hypothetical protein n=1 Tax=Streptomyces lavendulae TaxID=1914 RepID=UPI0024A13028|nr:hypothetical protein [Streptomyces lavendulae]GLV99162.1 hypothetical protein Slala05_27940 [Streptomyces lavendulae subsp. lavendulae]
MGGGATAYCSNLLINGKRANRERHCDQVDHSFKRWAAGTNRYVYCKDPAYNNYDCLASVEGLVFTLMGAGAATRVVISLVGGGSLSVAAIWQSC